MSELPPLIPGGLPAASAASCGMASQCCPASVKALTARAPVVGMRWISVSNAINSS